MSTIYSKLFDKSTLSKSHQLIITLSGKNNTILELGSASGYMSQILKENGNIVDIVEQDAEDASKASKFARNTYVGNLESSEFLEKITNFYDVVLAADVLEHLSNPEKVLTKIKQVLKKEGRLIVSLPNIACWPIRKDLFFKGKFEYAESGILDKTHLRFFSFISIQNFINQNGFRILNLSKMEILYPFRNSIKKIPLLGKFIDQLMSGYFTQNHPNLSVCHMVIECKKR